VQGEPTRIPEGRSRQEHLGVRSAVARLVDTDGKVVCTARFIATADDAVKIQVQLSRFTNASAGEHALIIHEKGSCMPTFAAAGGHFNPTGSSHGLLNPAGPHAGDLPNITIDGNGDAFYRVTTERAVLDAGSNSLFGADGSALLVHAAADDLVSQPDGGAGEAIACGVITTGSQQR
jgi:Cu-Zn family superoxide dismutase